MSGQAPTLAELDEQAKALTADYGVQHQEPAFLIRPAPGGEVVLIGLLRLPPQVVAAMLRAAATTYENKTPMDVAH